MAFLGVVVSVLAFMKPVVNSVVLITATIPASIMIVMEMRRWVVASYPGLPRLLSLFILQAIKAWGGLGTRLGGLGFHHAVFL